MLSKKVAV